MSTTDDFAVVKTTLRTYALSAKSLKWMDSMAACEEANAALSRLQQQAKEQEAEIERLREAISPGRINKDTEHYVKVAERMRAKELRIHATAPTGTAEAKQEGLMPLEEVDPYFAEAKPEAPAEWRCGGVGVCLAPDRCTVHKTKPESPATATECAHDVSNLRFYARLFEEHKWQDPVIHWSVFHQTLNEIASRIETLRTELAAANERAEAYDGQFSKMRIEMHAAFSERDADRKDLAEAVEALRDCAAESPWHHSCSDGNQEDTCITCCRRRVAAAIVARYDAQQGGKA